VVGDAGGVHAKRIVERLLNDEQKVRAAA
jgi:hypothetical protein